jgi:hypothetical protein
LGHCRHGGVQRDPVGRAALANQDNFIAPTTPESAIQFFKNGQDRYVRRVKKAGISLD